jgi:biopolymer transport protein ExbB/TolQ
MLKSTNTVYITKHLESTLLFLCANFFYNLNFSWMGVMAIQYLLLAFKKIPILSSILERTESFQKHKNGQDRIDKSIEQVFKSHFQCQFTHNKIMFSR